MVGIRTGTQPQVSDTGAKENEVSTGGKENGSTIGGVIFLLNNLPLFLTPADEYTLTDLTGPLPNVAGTYMLALEQILSSRLNDGGFIRNIFVNFGARGCCELNPRIRPSTRLDVFVEQLRHLFRFRVIYNADESEVACRMINRLASLMATLPANCRKIGCLHGADSLNQGPIMTLTEYVRAASDDQILMFVIGHLDAQIRAYIDDFVQVSEHELIATHGLSRVISALEFKLGLL